MHEAAWHKAGELLDLKIVGLKHATQFSGFDKGTIVVEARYETAAGEVFAIPDQHKARQERAVDGVKDKNAARSQHTRNF